MSTHFSNMLSVSTIPRFSLSLPHHSTLQRLYSKIRWIVNLVHFLERAIFHFNQRNRNVIVHLDEIHVKSEFIYQGERSNTIETAKPFLLLWFPYHISLCQILESERRSSYLASKNLFKFIDSFGASTVSAY